MLPGSFTVPRLTPSSPSPGTMPPFPGMAHGGLAAVRAPKLGSFSHIFQHPATWEGYLLAHACLCGTVDEQEELDNLVTNISALQQQPAQGLCGDNGMESWSFSTAKIMEPLPCYS
jgi:hypothetical protein